MSRLFYGFSIRQIAFVGAAFFILLLALQMVFFVKPRRHAHEMNEWVIHTDLVINRIQDLSNRLKDAELGQRGFFLTGNPAFLVPYHNSIGTDKSGNRRTPETVMAELRELTRDNPQQQENLHRLEDLVQQKMAFIQKTLDVYAKQGLAPVLEMIKAGEGKDLMDRIRSLIDRMTEHENKLMAQRRQTYKEAVQRFNTYMLLAAFLTYGSLLATIILIIRNFSRIQKTETELRAKEADFRAAAEGGMDAFFIFRAPEEGNTEQLKLHYLNEAAEKMLDLPFQAAKNMPIEKIMTQQHEEGSDIHQKYQGILSGHKAQQDEYMVATGHLAGRFFQQQSVPLSNGIAISCRDITERKQVEKMKNEFVSTVSHELRTPLTSIRGSLGLITGGLAGAIPEKADGLLKIAYNNCERLVRLINDILDVEKIESGKMAFDTRPLALAPLIRQAVEANRAFADKYQVQLAFDEVEDTGKVLADSDRLMQVLTNLLSNAIKFSHTHGTVSIQCRKEEEYIRVEVRDEGKGIPAEFQNRIFEKFAQADSSDTRQKGGTGLGLSIVKAIVEQMKGTIHFTSVPEKGTSFYFTLPIAQKKTGPLRLVEKEETSAQKILICEDEEDIANFLQLILEQAGFEVDIAFSAEEARAKLESTTYNAITLDLMLPDMDGIAFIRQLRADARFFHLPIIVVSAKAEEGRRALNGDAIGILDWLVKPIDVVRLVEIVQNLSLRHDRARILHVEDDKDIAQVLKLSLSAIADIIWTDHLQEARELIHNNKFDLAILDVGLPDGKGTDLLPLLGSQSDYPVPVVLFTATEVPQEISSRVAAALTKARTSEEKLLTTIRNIIIAEKKRSIEGRAP